MGSSSREAYKVGSQLPRDSPLTPTLSPNPERSGFPFAGSKSYSSKSSSSVYVSSVGVVSKPTVAVATTPLPLLLGSMTLTLGALLYPNPPAISLISRTPPSSPITGTALAPTPPPPEITTMGPVPPPLVVIPV